MCTPTTLNQITDSVVKAARESLGDRLDKVILYGSYARGKYDAESDIDIMVLADIPIEDTNRAWKLIWDITGDLDLKYDVIVSVHVRDCTTFYKFINDLPFYINVVNEGVELGA